jgi:hypothetical protein
VPDHEIIDEAKPWLVIPYFAGDKGRKGIERDPLPLPAIWWLCKGMRVNGGPLREYTPDEPTVVDVDVCNYGGGAAETPATVTVWWSAPTVGFGPAKWFGEAQTVLASKGGAGTVTVTGTIPAGYPHVCLLVGVEAGWNDNLPDVPGPGSDRHWAQLNIDVVKAPDGVFRQKFLVGNPQDVPARVHVRARLLAGERLAAVAEALQVTPFRPDRAELRVPTAAGEDPPERLEGAVPVDLEPGGSVALELRGEISPPPEPGTAAIVEIVQYAPYNPDTVTGALAVAVTND